MKALPVVLLLFFAMGVARAEVYGPYGLFPQGTAKVMAVGGAYTGLSDDYNGVLYNPAGLAMGDGQFKMGGDTNHVYNLEADLNGDGHRDGLPYNYFSYAAALKLGDFGLGLGISTPYEVNLSFPSEHRSAGERFDDQRTLELSISSFNIALAYRLWDFLSAGITLHGEGIRERYERVTSDPGLTPIRLETSNDDVGSITLGIAFRPVHAFGLGFSFQPRRTFNIDTSLNAQTDGVNWFRSAVIPSKTTLGLFWQFWSSWSLFVDLDWFGRVNDAVYVGSELIPAFSRIEISPKSQFLLHGGVEWAFLDTQWLDLAARAGTYHEPSRLRGYPSRNHTTYGLEIRPALLLIQASADVSREFLNYTIGLGLSLKML